MHMFASAAHDSSDVCSVVQCSSDASDFTQVLLSSPGHEHHEACMDRILWATSEFPV